MKPVKPLTPSEEVYIWIILTAVLMLAGGTILAILGSWWM